MHHPCTHLEWQRMSARKAEDVLEETISRGAAATLSLVHSRCVLSPAFLILIVLVPAEMASRLHQGRSKSVLSLPFVKRSPMP